MITPGQNYQQDKINGINKQTVILDEAETAETDQLDPKYHEDPTNEPVKLNQDNLDEDADLKGEKLYTEPAPANQEPTEHDADLNHNAEDDLSLNKPADDVF